MKTVSHLVSCLLFFATFTLARAEATAQDLVWNEDWPRFGVAEGVATGVFGAGALLTGVLLEEPEHARWNKEILLDLATRRALGAESAQGEHTAARISDVTVVSMIVAPIVVDSGISAWLVHDSPDVALQMALISAETIAVNFFLTNVTKQLAARARPRLAECFAAQEADPTHECEPRPNVSFFSGHSSSAFAGAGLMCAFSGAMDLYGDGLTNRLPCIAGLALAGTTVTLRLVANKHHLSDVVVGSAVGLLSGWFMPWLLHFRHGDRVAMQPLSAAVVPTQNGAVMTLRLSF